MYAPSASCEMRKMRKVSIYKYFRKELCNNNNNKKQKQKIKQIQQQQQGKDQKAAFYTTFARDISV